VNILALDTSTKNFSLAVFKNNTLAAKENIVLDKVLSDSIIPAIDAVLKKAKMPLAGVDGFAVGLGPGSFTSLRVGLSTVKGFCLALQRPVVGISSLDLIAMNVTPTGKEDICVMTDAKRHMVYAAIFSQTTNGLKRKAKYLLCEVKDLLPLIHKETIFVGDAIALYRDEIKQYSKKMKIMVRFEQETAWFPQAEHLAVFALEQFKKKKTDDINKLVPLYLYAQDCQVTR